MSTVRRYATGFGVSVGLESTDATAPALDSVLPYWWRDEDPAAGSRVFGVPDGGTAADAVGALELWVAEHAPGLVFVHAAVVAVGGRALLLPGRSFAGKSTLAAELVRRGCAYGSDEYAVLQPDGRVRAYPRPIALRTPDGAQRRSVTELGGTVMAEPLPVIAVADLRFVDGEPTQLEPMSAAGAALRLFDNAVCASVRPEETLEAVTGAVRDARAVRGVRGDAAHVVDDLLGLLDPPDDQVV